MTASYTPKDTIHTASSGSTTVSVITRSTTTAISCTPSWRQAAARCACTAAVSASASGTATPPLGTVSFAVSPATGSVTPSSCTLAASGTDKSSCDVAFSATATGSYTITASYTPNDTIHTASTERPRVRK